MKIRATNLFVLVSLIASLLLPAAALAEGGGEAATSPEAYTVQPGDSLSVIAQQQYGDMKKWPALYAANTQSIGADPNLIEPGQVLQVPVLKKEPTTFACNGALMSLAEIAAYRGVSMETWVILKTGRAMTPEELCVIPEDKLQRAITKVQHPRPDHPDEAITFRLLQLQDENGYIPPDAYAKAAKHIAEMTVTQRDAGIGNTSWEWIGPGNVGGRIRSIVISPTNPSQMWLGSVSGGIWQSNDAGASWQAVDDFMANLAVSTMVMNPVTHSTIYAGTGEGFYNIHAIRGEGVFKSTDAGKTWTQLSSTANSNWYYVNRLTISPDGKTILAGTRDSGIWRSTDGGATWSNQLLWMSIGDLDFSPASSANAIAGTRYGEAYYSTDGGVTWTVATFTPALTSAGRIEVAYAPSASNIVYASVNQNHGEIWKSADGGQTYTRVNTGNDYLVSQGWYDNIVWVNPQDPNFVVVGGVDLWRSTDGGATLNKISTWWRSPLSAHADHHAITAHPDFDNNTNRIVYFGNDGGIYRTDDISGTLDAFGLTDWQELNNNLGITQFYGGGGNLLNGKIYGGAQDNGDWLYTGGTETWRKSAGGDGGFAAVDSERSYYYGEYITLQIHRSDDGAWAQYIHNNGSPNGLTDAGSNANFIAPFILDTNDPTVMLAGGGSLWRSTNITHTNTSSVTWSAIKPELHVYNDNISAIAVAPGNSNIIWVGHNNGYVYSTTNGTAVSPTWTAVDTNTMTLPDRYVTRITIDPRNNNTVYVAFGGFSPDNLWKSANGGATWTDITGSGATGLPDAPVRDLDIHPDNSNWLYASTEVGIFTSEDGGATWKLPHDGPANVSVDESFWMDRDLIAVTYGRGMFRASTGDSSGNISVSKAADSTFAVSGNVVTYTITVNNPNPTATLTLALTDVIPVDTTFSGATNGGQPDGNGNIVWTNLSVPSYTKKAVAQVSFLVGTSLYTQLINTAQAASNEFALTNSQPVTVSRCNGIFYDNHEAAITNWTESYSATLTENHWIRKTDNGGYNGSANYWHVAEFGGWTWANSLSWLDSKAIAATAVISNSKPVLSFKHKYNAHASVNEAWNIGRLYIKVNNGGWQYISATRFITNGNALSGYSSLPPATSNPPRTRLPGFSGNSGDYLESQVDLSGLIAPGDSLQLRFEFDNAWASGKDGWFVDDAAICAEYNGPYFSVGKTASPVAAAGQPVTYTLLLSNISPVDLSNLLLTDTIPANAHYLSGGTRIGNVVSWTISSLPAFSSAERTFVVTATQTITNSNYRLSHSSGYTTGNSVTTQIVAPDVAIAKSVTPAAASPGDTVTYTLVFTNESVTEAEGVVVTDMTPISVTNVSVSSSGAAIVLRNGTRYVWDVANLTAGQGGVITLSGVLSDPLAAGRFTNTASINASYDDNAANNSATAAIDVLNRPPQADAGNNQIVLPAATVTLNGSASSDPDGNYPLSYLWTQTGGVAVSFTPNISVTTFTAPASKAVLTFTLSVTDSLGMPAPTPDEVVVTVNTEDTGYTVYLPIVLRQ